MLWKIKIVNKKINIYKMLCIEDVMKKKMKKKLKKK